MDYFHYNYQCPYMSGTDSQKVYCDGSSRLIFPDVGACREFLHRYCADPAGWEHCSVARMQTDHIMRKLQIQRGIRDYNRSFRTP